MDEGALVLEYKIPEGQAISFRVGGTIQALMQRTDAPVPDVDMRLVAGSANKEPVTVEYEHALSGLQTVVLQPGHTLSINPVVSRRWTMSAPNWEDPGKKDGCESRKTKGRRITPPLGHRSNCAQAMGVMKWTLEAEWADIKAYVRRQLEDGHTDDPFVLLII